MVTVALEKTVHMPMMIPRKEVPAPNHETREAKEAKERAKIKASHAADLHRRGEVKVKVTEEIGPSHEREGRSMTDAIHHL